VIAAARKFICIRLLTYENEEEMRLVKSFWVGGSGDVENTTVGIFAPDGKTKLSRFHRSFTHLYRSPTEMATALSRISSRYGIKTDTVNESHPLPKVVDVRRAVNVAASDNQPLVVIYAQEEATRQRLEERISSLAWSRAFLGRYVYVTAATAAELKTLSGTKAEPGVLVVQPDQFGMEGKVVAQVVGSNPSTEELAALLKKGLPKTTVAQKDQRSHQRAGQRQGIFWETQTPVSDPMERMARERTKRFQEMKR
jgi:hypothetical protein